MAEISANTKRESMELKITLPHDTRELVAPKEAARITGYSQYWLQKKRANGGGPPFIKNGHFIYYIREELIHFRKPSTKQRKM